MKRRQRGLVLIHSRGVPSRRQWEGPSFVEADLLRQLAKTHGVKPVDVIQAFTIHRTRVALERKA